MGEVTPEGDGDGVPLGLGLADVPGLGGCVQLQVGTGAGVGTGGFGVFVVACGRLVTCAVAGADVGSVTGTGDRRIWDGAGAACAGRPAGGVPGSSNARIPVIIARTPPADSASSTSPAAANVMRCRVGERTGSVGRGPLGRARRCPFGGGGATARGARNSTSVSDHESAQGSAAAPSGVPERLRKSYRTERQAPATSRWITRRGFTSWFLGCGIPAGPMERPAECGIVYG
ncbi:MAG: hypothetical protein HOV96_41335 [Nonomuraea sp.]|nr:hypothetical protein [Nonomuraea sp.]